MENNFEINVDDALNINLLVKWDAKAMKTFFDDLAIIRKEARKNNRTLFSHFINPNYVKIIRDLRDKYGSLKQAAELCDIKQKLVTGVIDSYHYGDSEIDFLVKYDYLIDKMFQEAGDFFGKLFDTSLLSVIPIVDYQKYTKYVLANKSNLRRINAIENRLSTLGIANIVYSPLFDFDGKHFTDFNFKYGKTNKSMGVRTLYSLTDGIISDIDENNYSYNSNVTNYMINLVIEPKNKTAFDLTKNVGYYQEKTVYQCLTNKCSEKSSAINVENRAICVSNLLFDSKSLPNKITLDETIFKMFPGLKQRLEYNQKIEECDELIENVASYFSYLDGIDSNLIDYIKEAQCGDDLKNKYIMLVEEVNKFHDRANGVCQQLTMNNKNK